MNRHRRYVKGVAFGNLGFCTSYAIDHQGKGPEWVEVVEVDLHLPNLPESFQGKRLIQVSDLHCSRTVSVKYLTRCVQRVNSLDPDFVLLTGDYVTHDLRGKYRERIVNLVADIESRYGIYACLGNHDYGIGSVLGSWNNELLFDLIDGLQAKGINLLRNRAEEIEIDGKNLWFVGLGDVWVKDFDPDRAFAKVPADQPSIALLHNPDGFRHMAAYPAHTILSGHTHGVQTTFADVRGLRITTRPYHAGMYRSANKSLYVNRGLGRLGSFFLNSRPEITVFTLR